MLKKTIIICCLLVLTGCNKVTRNETVFSGTITSMSVSPKNFWGFRSVEIVSENDKTYYLSFANTQLNTLTKRGLCKGSTGRLVIVEKRYSSPVWTWYNVRKK